MLLSCNYQVKLKGIVIDEINHLPVSSVQVRTLKGANAKALDFVSTSTDKEGRFEIVYDSNQSKPDELSVEVSKPNYLTNIYTVHQESFDTIILRRSIQNEFEFIERTNRP